MAKTKAKKIAAKRKASAVKKSAKKRRHIGAKVKEETFVLQEPEKSEFLEQRPAPPEERIDLIIPPAEQRQKKPLFGGHKMAAHEKEGSPVVPYASISRQFHRAKKRKGGRLFRLAIAVVASAAVGAALAAVLTQFLHMSLLYSLGISGALFVAFFIVFYTVLEPVS